jgi:hypothetical protein
MNRLRSIAGVVCSVAIVLAALAYLYDPPWIGRVTTGLGAWEEYPEGVRYRWTSGHATLFVPSDATAVTIPMRAGFPGMNGPAVTVKVTVDDRSLPDLVLPDPAAWFRAELTLPRRRTRRRVRRIDLRVDRPAGPMSLGVQIGEVAIKGASDVDTVQPGPLLFATDIAPGTYRFRVMRKSLERGEVTLGVGRAGSPVARWPLSDALIHDYAFRLPVRAVALSVKGDSGAIRSVERVAFAAQSPAEATPQAGRATDAVRYGGVVLYALDERVWLEQNGFWVMGDRRPDVLISADDPRTSIDLIVHNRPAANTIRVRSGQWSVVRVLAPDEAWPVHIPLAEPARDVIVNFDVARGVRPFDVDPNNSDRRSLGCWVEVR